jgi:3-oxoacyl-[acyl-carrier-protein] synthase-1
MITAVGFNALSSCAAIRGRINLFKETQFIDQRGEWIVAASVPLTPALRGREKLAHLAASSIKECLTVLGGISTDRIPLLLCVAEDGRPGRIPGLNGTLLSDVSRQLGVQFHTSSRVITNGRVGGVEAIREARQLIDRGNPCCLIAGVDSYLVAATLSSLEQKDRLLTNTNLNGFIPGEAGAAVLVASVDQNRFPQLVCRGIGFGTENATVESEEPLRADGLAKAVRAAMDAAGCTFDDVDYRLTDVSGEQYGFKEATLAMTRIMKQVKPEFDIWHPSDCIGEIGAAIVPCLLGVAYAAATKGYAPGEGVLCHCGNDDGRRAAMLLKYQALGAA